MLILKFEINKDTNDIRDFLRKKELVFQEIIDKTTKKIGVIFGEKHLEEIIKRFKVTNYYTSDVPYKFVSREFKECDSIIEVNGTKIGGDNFVIMSGPCSIEDKEMIFESAKVAKKNGASILRGGAFKPRTSPYSFQGLGEEGLIYIREAADMYNLSVVTELMDEKQFDLVEKYTDIIQIGARNMQNFSLLKKLGESKKPILLKRGMAARVEDLLMAAEYIIAHGNPNVILCERGIRTFETSTRNTLDLNSVALIKELTHLPIIVDASHGTGKSSLVPKLTLAGIAVGADGVMVETHKNPSCALSDGDQSLNYDEFSELCRKMTLYLEVEGRRLN